MVFELEIYSLITSAIKILNSKEPIRIRASKITAPFHFKKKPHNQCGAFGK